VRPGAACFTSAVRALAAASIAAAALFLVTPAYAVEASASVSSARITWTTPAPTRAVVAYGVDGRYLYSPREPVATTTHAVTLTDLQPGTTYTYSIGSAQGTVTTAARTEIPGFGVDGTHITADGSLFFPVLSYEQCTQTIDRALAIGVNTFVQVPFTGCTQPADMTPPYVLSDDYKESDGVGWYLPDEPDGWGITPDEMPQLPAAGTTGRLRVLNVSQHFFSGQAPINDQFDRNDYKRFAADADVVGFDMYPIVKFCGRVSLLEMFRAQRELMTIYAPGKPTFQWIETSRMTGECPTIAISPEIVNAETWLAATGGACGIGYFTNSWTGDLWNRWDFDPGVEAALPAIVARVQRLAPVLCAAYRDVVVPWNGTIAASARELNGALYVLAVNSSDRATTIPFRVDGLAGRALSVLDEGRVIKPVKKVYFRDRFEPYAVHVYAAAPK
jgi:Purple acid Phosphatase, N-terminal domain